MTKRDAASIALKIVGIVLLVQAIVTIPTTANEINMLLREQIQNYPGNSRLTGALEIVTLALQIAAALYLLLRADAIAAWIVPEDGPVGLSGAAMRQRPLFAMVTRVVGVIFLAQGVPGLVRWVTQVALEARTAPERFGVGALDAFRAGAWTQEWTGLAGAVAAVLVGLLLLFWADGLAGIAIREDIPDTAQSD